MVSDVWILVMTVMITMLCVAGVVLWILRREYLPVIRRLEREARSAERSPADSGPERGP